MCKVEDLLSRMTYRLVGVHGEYEKIDITLLRYSYILAGATGYIGAPIAVELGKAGIHTSALVRPGVSTDKREAALKKLKEANVTIIEGSLDDADFLAKTLKDFDTVISALSGVLL